MLLLCFLYVKLDHKWAIYVCFFVVCSEKNHPAEMHTRCLSQSCMTLFLIPAFVMAYCLPDCYFLLIYCVVLDFFVIFFVLLAVAWSSQRIWLLGDPSLNVHVLCLWQQKDSRGFAHLPQIGRHVQGCSDCKALGHCKWAVIIMDISSLSATKDLISTSFAPPETHKCFKSAKHIWEQYGRNQQES